MDLITYVLCSFGFLIFWQLTLYMKNEMGFDFMLMAGTFVLGGILGWFLQTYEVGFVVAVVLSLIFL